MFGNLPGLYMGFKVLINTTFRRIKLPPSSRSKSISNKKTSKKQAGSDISL
jgi:hypothetical protein